MALATGHQLSALPQSAQLPTYAVSGQVSHIPSTPGLKALNTVLCYDGYLTPVSPQFGTHCIGASYHRGDTATAYREEDQQQNRTRLLHSLPGCGWAEKVDVSAGEARIGVRCATRDHLPMAGAVPDYDATLASYADLPEQRARGEAIAAAPHYAGLFLLGALGSRGLCSAPLAAEVLAAQMSGEPQPLDRATLAALSPNRYWVRKLLKGKKRGNSTGAALRRPAVSGGLARLLEQVVPHADHQHLIARRQLAGGNGVLQAVGNLGLQRFRRMLARLFDFRDREGQVTAQIAAGEQLVIAGVIDHIVNQGQNTRFKFCDHLNSSLVMSALITDRLARETVLTSVQACHKSPPER